MIKFMFCIYFIDNELNWKSLTKYQSVFPLLYLEKPENTTQQYIELGEVNRSSNYDELNNHCVFSVE